MKSDNEVRHPPGPRGWEATGFFGASSLDGMLRFFENTAKRYGPLTSLCLLHKRIYLGDEPELIQERLVTRQHEFVRDAGATLGRELDYLTREEPLHRERGPWRRGSVWWVCSKGLFAQHRDCAAAGIEFAARLVRLQ